MEYSVIYSKRKSVSLRVDKSGRAVVRAPIGYPKGKIEAFVEKHRLWIFKRQAEVAAYRTPDFSDGAELTLFGKKYVISSTRSGDGILKLSKTNRQKSLIAALRSMTLRETGALTQKIAREGGFSYTGIRVSSAKSRWGSCNAKRHISYTFYLAFLPMRLVEYVCVHELAHTKEMNHSARFWAVVEKIMPDYKERRKELKSHREVFGYFENT